MIFAQELFSDAFKDMEPLLIMHYEEISHHKHIPIEPWIERYQQLEDAGALKIFTVREESGLIGYAVFIVSRSLHNCQIIQAVQDIVFIEKEKRGFGKSFLAWCDEQLKALGVQIVYHHVNHKHNWGSLLDKLGYELVDLVYGKRLDT